MKGKKSKKWIVPTAIVVAVAIIGGVYISGRIANSTAAAASNENIKTVTRGAIDVTVHGTGAVQFTTSDPLYAPFGAKVLRVAVKDGDIIQAGETIATLDVSDIEDSITKKNDDIKALDSELSSMANASGSSTIYSPIEGRIKKIYAAKDDEVSAVMNNYGSLCMLSADGRMRLKLDTSALAQSAIPPVGERVQVYIDKKKETGQVTKFENHTLTITINNDRYDIGATARVEWEEKALGEAALELNSPLPVTGVNGTISSVSRKVNDYVYDGNTLFRLKGDVLSQALQTKLQAREDAQQDLDDLFADKEKQTLVAPYDCVISELSITEGQPVKEDALVCRTNSTEAFELTVAVDELDIAQVAEGQSASIKVDALSEKRFTGTVTRISALGNAVNGVTTYDVTMTIDDPDQIRSAMTASADISTAKHEDVLLLPINAVYNKDGQSVVYLPPKEETQKTGRGTTYETKPIKIGLYNDQFVEILEGLAENERVMIVNSNDSIFNMMGGGNMRNSMR